MNATTYADASTSRNATQRRWLLKNLLLQGELVQVTRALHEAGIGSVVLKGVPLVRRIYGQVGGRAICDNDLLVRERDVRQTVTVLRGLGYDDLRRVSLDTALAHDFEFPLVRQHADTRLLVDLHWKAFPPYLHDIDDEIVWRNTELVDVDDSGLRVPSRALSVVHLAAHFEQHCFCEPRILQDFVFALVEFQNHAGDSALRQVETLAKLMGMADALSFALSCAESLGLLKPAMPFAVTPRARLLARLLPPNSLNFSQPVAPTSHLVKSLILLAPDRIPSWFKRHMMPPIEQLAEVYQREPSARLYLAYVARFFHPAARALGWSAPWERNKGKVS